MSDDDDDDLEGEEQGDDEGDEGDEGSSTPFDDDTEGRLVAGRSFELGGMTGAQITALKLAIDALAARAGLPLDFVPGGDFTSTGPSPSDALHGRCVLGLSAGRGGTFAAEAIRRALAIERLAAAQALPAAFWDEIAALLPERPRESFRESAVALWLVCVGPLAAATLAFGVEGAKDAAGLPGEYHGGQDMEQESFKSGVWGEKVGYVQYEGPEVALVDLSDEAHARRVAALARSSGDYYLLARYD